MTLLTDNAFKKAFTSGITTKRQNLNKALCNSGGTLGKANKAVVRTVHAQCHQRHGYIYVSSRERNGGSRLHRRKTTY